MTRSLRDYITEAEQYVSGPVEGDAFDIEIAPGDIVSTYVLESTEDSITLYGDEQTFALLEEIKRYGAVGANPGMGYSVAEADGDQVKKVFKRAGKPVGEVGIDPDGIGSPDATTWYIKHYASDTDLGGYDSYEEAAEELRHLVKQMVPEAMIGKRRPRADRYHIVKKDGEPANLASYPDRASAQRDRDAKHPDAEVHLVGSRGKVKAVSEDQSFQRMMELAGIQEAEANTSDPLADKAAALAPVGAMGSAPAVNVDEGVMKGIAAELGEIADSQDYDALYDLMTATTPAGQMVQKIANDIAVDNQLYDDDHEELLELVMDRLIDDFGGQDIDEAKYQRREVPLNKPMAGDVKKSKVYVKDPSTGNVKKVNFGDPDMKIKKSNPARRRSFRARHNCDNPGPRTKARYWSCRAW